MDVSGGNIGDGAWHQIAMVVDRGAAGGGGRVSAYQDGHIMAFESLGAMVGSTLDSNLGVIGVGQDGTCTFLLYFLLTPF